jgi:hypothetical protein
LLEGTEAGAADSITKATGVGAKDRQRLIQRTAVYGPVCTVVWEGRSRKAPPYPDCACLDGADVAAGKHGAQGRANARKHGANAQAFCPPGQAKKSGLGSRFQC